MLKRVRDGVSLAYADTGGPGNVLVLIHGWGCDHTTLMRQQSFFEGSYRVINLDLRGHGESSSPQQTYSIQFFAEDVAWLCDQLRVERAVFVGHSMGGAVALEVAFHFPELVKAVCLLDTVFQAPPELFDALSPLLPGLHGSTYALAYRDIMEALSLASDFPEVEPVLALLPSAPQHVLLSALNEHLETHDFERAASAARSMRTAYIAAAHPLASIERLKQLIPEISVGQTLGSGHFAPWLVHEQVNAMLLRFFVLVERGEPAHAMGREVNSGMLVV